MKIALQIIGILIICISGIFLLLSLLVISTGNQSEDIMKIAFYSIVGLIIGIFTTAGSSSIQQNNKKSFDKQEFEEFKRYQEQQRQILYRNANAHGKPISEYLMDDRTKLVTYYDRMSANYKSKLVNYADTLYRNYENEEYLNRK